ncbi:PilN family type IVB pilus formation outer membrane protein [Yersinia enterocolitica]
MSRDIWHSFLSKFVLSVFSFSLYGCSGINNINRTDNEIDGNSTLLTSQVDKLRHSQNKDSASLVKIHDNGFWVDRKNVPLRKESVSVNCRLTLNESDALSLNELGRKITSICHIPVTVDRSSGPENNDISEPMVSVNWQGPLSGLLDDIGTQAGYSWRMIEGRITFYRYATQTFQIYALPSTDIVNLGLTTSGSSGGGSSSGSSSGGDSDSGASSNVSVTSTLTSEVLRDIEGSVKSMLSPTGKMSLSSSTAGLTVTDTATVLKMVSYYIEQQNKLLTTQVLLNVKVFNIDFNRDDQYAIDWNAAYKSSDGLISWITKSATSTPVNGTINLVRGNLDASAFIHALSSQGKVSILTQPSITTLNLQAAPMAVTTEQSYVASVASSLVQSVGSQMSVTPGVVNTGFTMGLLPYVMNNKQLLLQYSINLSDLDQLSTFTTGTGENQAMVQLPEVSRRAFNQKVKINSGETLILSGFEQGHLSTDMDGTGSPTNQWLGGSRKGKNSHSVLVIMITPMVIS